MFAYVNTKLVRLGGSVVPTDTLAAMICLIAKLNLSIKFIHHDSSKTISGSFHPEMSLLNRVSTLVDGELSRP